MNTLTRILKLGVTSGKDIEGVTRAMLRYLDDGKNWRTFYASLPVVRRYYGPAKVNLAKRSAVKAGLPQYGVVGPQLETALRKAQAFDEKANQLLDEYAESIEPKLVEPKQGWGSLHRSLWPAYSIGRRAGFSDLGTYNSLSRLPSGRPSDHAVYPAMAFDLGIDPDTGWNNIKARYYVQKIVRLVEVEYVILGNRIWVNRGWGTYRFGGHLNHVHVSGKR